jgi:hypothetical protein
MHLLMAQLLMAWLSDSFDNNLVQNCLGGLRPPKQFWLHRIFMEQF